MFEHIKANIREIKERIANAAMRSGRNPEEITLVAVSKRHPAEMIKAAVEAGVTDIGESRVQEALPKINELGNITRWHMIGHLQTNKVSKAAELFDMIQSVDSIKLAETLNRAAESHGRTIDCLLEINSTGENSKFGVTPDEVMECINKMIELKHLRLCGVMTIGPFTDDLERIHSTYRMTCEIFKEARKIADEHFTELSMGMSDDFEIAVEEGSTMVRVGTAIFGPRGG